MVPMNVVVGQEARPCKLEEAATRSNKSECLCIEKPNVLTRLTFDPYK